MPYSRVTRTAYGAGAIRYARGDDDGIGHDGTSPRNALVTTVNMLPDDVIPVEDQMRPVWARAAARHTTRVDRFIVSFSRNEIDPEDPAGAVLAGQICTDIASLLCNGFDPGNEEHRALADEMGFDPETFVLKKTKDGQKSRPLTGQGRHQAAIFIQKDGTGGLYHGHILVNDVAADTGRSLNANYYYVPYLRKMVDHVVSKYVDLDLGKTKAKEIIPQTVRAKRNINAAARTANAIETAKASAEGRSPVIQPMRYIWRDDMCARIRDAAQSSASEDQFFEECRARGVEVMVHDPETARRQKKPKYYTYALVDTSKFPPDEKIPSNRRARSYRMGTDYEPEGIAEMFLSKEKEEEEMIRRLEPEQEPENKTFASSDDVWSDQTGWERRDDVYRDDDVADSDNSDDDDKLIPVALSQIIPGTAVREAMAMVYPAYARAMGMDPDAPPLDPDGAFIEDRFADQARIGCVHETWQDFRRWHLSSVIRGHKEGPMFFRNEETGEVHPDREILTDQYTRFLRDTELEVTGDDYVERGDWRYGLTEKGRRRWRRQPPDTAPDNVSVPETSGPDPDDEVNVANAPNQAYHLLRDWVRGMEDGALQPDHEEDEWPAPKRKKQFS